MLLKLLAAFLLLYAVILFFSGFAKVPWMIKMAKTKLGKDATDQKAIKLVYASTFSQHAKAYLRATPYRLEEEKMAVLLQRIVGSARGGRFYPDFSGVARSHNFYPTPPLEAGDGIVAVALGMEDGIGRRVRGAHPLFLGSLGFPDGSRGGVPDRKQGPGGASREPDGR